MTGAADRLASALGTDDRYRVVEVERADDDGG